MFATAAPDEVAAAAVVPEVDEARLDILEPDVV